LKLLDEDYSEHGMADLLTERGPAYGLNIDVFNELQHTITGWPGGKPNADDSHRPERAAPHPKRVVVFSPEPSHAVLGMGGTLRRLVDQGHDVSVICQTSGSLALPDEEALLAVDLVGELSGAFELTGGPAAGFAADVGRQLRAKAAFAGDISGDPAPQGPRPALRGTGGAGGLRVGRERVRFADLAFDERGRYRQFRPDATDVAAVVALLRELRPHQIFATGDRDDPSSITAVCFELIRRACAELQDEAWFAACRVLAVPRCRDRVGRGGDRHGRAVQPARARAEDAGDLPSSEPAQSDPGGGRAARTVAAGRAAQPRPRLRLRRPRPRER
jgi:glucosamine-6-phosphate deaminase